MQTVNTGCKSLKALDYGCGSGNITNQLLNLNINVVAADVSSHFLTLVRQKFSCDRLSTLSLNGKDLIGVEADSFDFIAVYSVLHHIPDYLAAITELARVCKPGGVIYIDHEQNDEQVPQVRLPQPAQREAHLFFPDHWMMFLPIK